MKLDRLIFVNWGHMAAGTYEMGNLTLLTGPTGAGKSTMLDAMQVVLTAANKNIMNLNPGQDEMGQGGAPRDKTRRSVEGYLVGAEKNLFARPHGAHGYIAAVFHPDDGEHQCQPFTALVAASARVEGGGEARQPKLEQFNLFLVDSPVVEEDFLLSVDSGEVVAVDNIHRALKLKYKVHEFNDRKTDYLSALYGRFRGRSTVNKDEALLAAKAWVQSVAYRKIGAVHELVRDEILDMDQKQLQGDVERISGLMKDVATLRHEGARLHENSQRLEKLLGLLAQTSSSHEGHVVQEVYTARLRLEADKSEEQRQRQRVQQCENDKKTRSAASAERKERKGRLDSDRTTLAARMMGVPAQQQKAGLEARIGTATANARRVLYELSQSLSAAAILDKRAQMALATRPPAAMDRVTASLAIVADAYRGTDLLPLADVSPKVFEQAQAAELSADVLREIALVLNDENDLGLPALFASLSAPQDSLQNAVTQQAVLHEKTMADAEKRVRELGNRKAALARGEVEYPPAVKVAMRVLQEQYPEAMAQVLCDLVEPKSEEWQAAIEGYIKGARFSILVKPEWERDVINLVRQRDWREVKVLQGKLCLKDLERQGPPPPNSIVHELLAPNDIAWAYLASQYGTVLKVKSVEELQATKRGLMIDGKASGSRTYFLADAKELVFGKKARERQLRAVTQELEQAQNDWATFKEQEGSLAQMRQALIGLREVNLDATSLIPFADELSAAQQALAALDLTELEDMQRRLNQLLDEVAEIDRLNEEDVRAIAGADKDILAANRVVSELLARRDALLEAVQTQAHRLGELVKDNPALNFSDLSARADALLARPGATATASRDVASGLDLEARHHLTGALNALSEYHQVCRNDERFQDALAFPMQNVPFDATYRQVVALAAVANERVSAVRGTGIYNNQLELEKATKSFNDVFTKHFCVEIKTRVDEGMRTLRQMNNELRNLSFGQDSYIIDWSQWEPELRDYLEFFEAVAELTESAESLDLFGENELPARHVPIRDRLVGLLLSEDQDRARKELLRIADYRNYRRYDIICESPNGGRVRLSTWGTGSGGQMETPAYIVRAAVVTNRLKMFEKGPSLRFLVNDEAFSKMDETRARAVLCFMRDNLNLQVVSAMPTMKAGPLKDEFNREYNFTQLKPVTNGELDFCVEVKELLFKQDKMRLLWAAHRELARQKAMQLFDEQYPPPASEVVDEGAAK
ncbi:MAG: AAA family ATPase [Burkholderiales bacterium]|nr:MAG: AAA family ATPase [Burkholderiales bacterium]